MKRVFPIAIAAILVLATGRVALADAGTNASCHGIESSNISPPGSNSEVPGGMPEFNQAVKDIAAALGIPVGQIQAFFAQIHAGSHEACDAAVE